MTFIPDWKLQKAYQGYLSKETWKSGYNVWAIPEMETSHILNSLKYLYKKYPTSAINFQEYILGSNIGKLLLEELALRIYKGDVKDFNNNLQSLKPVVLHDWGEVAEITPIVYYLLGIYLTGDEEYSNSVLTIEME